MHIAACQEDSSLLEVVVKYCSTAELEVPDPHGKNALILAVENGHLKNVNILLEKKVL